MTLLALYLFAAGFGSVLLAASLATGFGDDLDGGDLGQDSDAGGFLQGLGERAEAFSGIDLVEGGAVDGGYSVGQALEAKLGIDVVEGGPVEGGPNIGQIAEARLGVDLVDGGPVEGTGDGPRWLESLAEAARGFQEADGAQKAEAFAKLASAADEAAPALRALGDDRAEGVAKILDAVGRFGEALRVPGAAEAATGAAAAGATAALAEAAVEGAAAQTTGSALTAAAGTTDAAPAGANAPDPNAAAPAPTTGPAGPKWLDALEDAARALQSGDKVGAAVPLIHAAAEAAEVARAGGDPAAKFGQLAALAGEAAGALRGELAPAALVAAAPVAVEALAAQTDAALPPEASPALDRTATAWAQTVGGSSPYATQELVDEPSAPAPQTAAPAPLPAPTEARVEALVREEPLRFTSDTERSELPSTGTMIGAILQPFLSLRFWSFMGMTFGLTGTLLTCGGADATLTFGTATGLGLAIGWAAFRLFRLLTSEQVSGATGTRHIVGREGLVMLPVSPGVVGRIKIELESGTTELRAKGDKVSLAVGDRALILHVDPVGIAIVSRAP